MSEVEDEQTQRRMDDQVTAWSADVLDPGEIVATWVTVIGVRCPDRPGYTLLMPMDDRMPAWEIRGLLHTAMETNIGMREEGGETC